MNVADRSLPPMVLEGDLEAQWKKWKQLFEIYLVASELDKKTESQQCAVLLHFIGEKCVEIFNTFEFSKEDEGKIKPLKNKFESYFAPKKNEIYCRYKFFCRNMESSETIDQYVTELKSLATNCNFENLKDSLIRDRIVYGITDNKTREKLLQTENLTLDKAVDICRSIEITKQQCSVIDRSNNNNDAILALNKNTHQTIGKGKTYQSNHFNKNDECKKMRGTPWVSAKPHYTFPDGEKVQGSSRVSAKSHYTFPDGEKVQGTSRVSAKSHHTHSSRINDSSRYNKDSNSSESQNKLITSCSRCGQTHNINHCPAFNKICNKCKKLNHFANQCKSKLVHTVNNIISNPVGNSNGNEYESNYFIGTVGQDNHTREWLVGLTINNSLIKFKIDTGAQANCMSLNTFKNLNLDLKYLKPSTCKLTTYTGAQINVVGECFLRCYYNNTLYFIKFQVIDGNEVPSILGIETCDTLQLVQKLFIVNTNNEIPEEFRDIFRDNGCIKMKPYNISINKDITPVVHPPRKVPFALMNELKAELNQLEKDGIVAKVNEPTAWVNSLVVVRKSNGKLRICIDPKDLNKAIKREHFQLPTVEEMLCKLDGAKYFSLLDASRGFWQIKLTKESSKLCTFNSPFGRYCFLRLPFGISSAPEVFHRTMKSIIQGLEGVDVYIDDLIIWGSTIEQHNRRLYDTLERLKHHNVSLNRSKCQILVQELNYLGHKISNRGIEPDENKIKAIKEITPPTNKKSLEKFLGMINYLSIYIENYSKIAAPLRELLKKSVCWHWNESHKDAFLQLQQAITNPPVLRYFDPKENIVLSVDASQHGVGSVLLQNNRPVAYSSKALTDTQKNWAQIEKELYAILCACERYYQYIYGRKVLIETDHKPLISIIKKPLVTCPKRLQRMLLRLQHYDFELEYKPGKKLFVADTLSRISKYSEPADRNFDKELEAHVCTLIKNLNISEPQLLKFQSLTDKDKQLTKLKEYITNGWPKEKNIITDNLNEFRSCKDELTIFNGLVFKNNQIVVPKELRKEMLTRLHSSHMGVEKCINRARDCIFWPNMKNDIKNVIRNCNACSTFRNSQSKEPLMPHEIPKFPWQKVGIDIFEFDHKNYLLCVDYYSKFFEIALLENMYATTIIKHLKSIFSRDGIPEVIMSDNGPQFTAGEFKLFSKQWEFKHITSSPRYPKSNGLVERYIQTIKNTLKKCKAYNNDIYLAMLELRNTPTKGGYTPSQLLNKRSLRSIVPVIYKTNINYNKYDKNIIKLQQQSKTYHDKNNKSLTNLKVDERIRVQLGKQWVPGQIKSQCERPRSYRITLNNGQEIERNRKFIKLDTVRPPGTLTYNNENEHLEATDESQNITNNDTKIDYKSDNDKNKEDSTDDSVEYQTNDKQVVTRSGRIVKPPDKYWLGKRK